MKAHSALALTGGVTGLSAGSAALMKNGSYEGVDMDMLEWEFEEARGDAPSVPAPVARGYMGYKGIEVVKFQKSLERTNSHSP